MPAVAVAAHFLFERAWVRDDSAFTPGRPVWTATHIDELHRSVVLQPDVSGDSFMVKFRAQLEPVSDPARQLAAELLYLNLLPLADYTAGKKRQIIQEVLGWMQQAPTIPSELDGALAHGVFNGGVAFKTQRWQQVSLLIAIAQQVKALPLHRREELMRDPWAFRDFVRGAAGPKQPAQRNSLLYLAHPDVFLPIVNVDHRKRIPTAFAEYVESPSGDADKDLYALRQAIDGEAGEAVDFYLPPFRERWDPQKTAEAEVPAGPDADVRRAWLVRGSSVKGVDLVPGWQRDGQVSLAASLLPPVEPGVGRDELKVLVDEGYSHVSYAQREQKLEEFHAFLSRMQPGDLVVTTSQGLLSLGRVTSDASYVASPDGRSNLRRAVGWSEQRVDFADLPPSVAASLQVQHDLVELTQHLAELEAMLPHIGAEPAPLPQLVLADASDELADDLLMDRGWLQECVELLRDRPQLIFYGPPGTGKTYVAQRLGWHLAGRERTTLVQFHPAYSYEDFFEGFRPVADVSGQVAFRLQAGPLRRIVEAARENPYTPYVLIIDEINRGNLAKIFGELYFLLEYRDAAIELLYGSVGERSFTLPPNVLLLGTMNTADRSIALVDAAMRRRFSFLSLHPAEEPTRSLLRRWLTKTGRSDEAARLLDLLNQRIDDAEMQVGPSYLMREAAHAPGGLERVWRTAILPLLEEHHYGDGTDVPQRYGLARLRSLVAPSLPDGALEQSQDALGES